MLSRTVDNGRNEANHEQGFKRLYKAGRPELNGLSKDIEIFMVVAPIGMQCGLMLAEAGCSVAITQHSLATATRFLESCLAPTPRRPDRPSGKLLIRGAAICKGDLVLTKRDSSDSRIIDQMRRRGGRRNSG